VVGLLAETCPYTNFASQFKNLWMHYTYRRQPRRVGLFFTSAAAIRRPIFVQEGGFDRHYAGASITEDIEFGQRLLSRDYFVVMDQRLTVEHQRRYTLNEVLRTDLFRARGLTQTWLRNRASATKRAHYASVPWYFGAGVLALGLATLFLLLALLLWATWPLAGAGLSALAALGASGISARASATEHRPLVVQSPFRGCKSLRSRLWNVSVGLEAHAMALMQRLLSDTACT